LRTPLGSSELSTEQTTKKATLSDFNFFALALLGKSVHPHEVEEDVPVFLFWVSFPVSSPKTLLSSPKDIYFLIPQRAAL